MTLIAMNKLITEDNIVIFLTMTNNIPENICLNFKKIIEI